jgi:glyoxylase-like metal-dependent hydrolase (beta-lactamase superfamily II)
MLGALEPDFIEDVLQRVGIVIRGWSNSGHASILTHLQVLSSRLNSVVPVARPSQRLEWGDVYNFRMVSPLLPLADGVHYLPGAVNCGVIATSDGGCILIDTGNTEDHGKKLLKACRALSLEPRAIINTHSHADHFGGNAYLVRELGIPVYAPIFEEAILNYPLLEPMYLWSGARAHKELQNKFLLSSPSPAKVLNEPGPRKIAGVQLELLEVAGHAQMQFAVKVGDVLFAADAVFGQAILDKHPLSFMVDIQNARDAIETVRHSDARVVLPGHGEPTTDIDALCDANLASLARANDAVLAACHEPSTLPEILERVCAMLEVNMPDLTRYVLNQTAVLAHLTNLEEHGDIRHEIIRNKLLWSVTNDVS